MAILLYTWVSDSIDFMSCVEVMSYRFVVLGF